MLVNALSARLPGAEGGLGAVESVPPEARAQVAPLMADAFGHAFWWALGLLGVAFVASFLLPRRKPDAVDDPDGDAGEVPVLMHA